MLIIFPHDYFMSILGEYSEKTKLLSGFAIKIIQEILSVLNPTGCL